MAMLRNQASALIEHERIQTTVARAKELRPYVEKIISIAKRSLNTPAEGTHHVTARRRVAQDIPNREVVTKLFDTIAPRFADRPGGYTRMYRLGSRRGDAAEVAEVELIGSEYDPSKVVAADKPGPDGADKPKKQTMGGRIRAALSGRKKTTEPDAAAAKGKTSRGAGKKITTPRKAGGS